MARTSQKNSQEQLAELKAQKSKITQEIKKLRKEMSEKEKQEYTNNILKIGSAVYLVLNDSYREGDEEKLVAFLKQQDQRDNSFSAAMGRPKSNTVTERVQQQTENRHENVGTNDTGTNANNNPTPSRFSPEVMPNFNQSNQTNQSENKTEHKKSWWK